MPEQSWSLELPSALQATARARHFVRSVLAAWGASAEVVDDVQLLVSELVTNSVVHAGSAPCLRLTAAPTALHVSVDGGASTSPRFRDGRSEAEGGRGLLLVDALASRWGFHETASGKCVWFVIEHGRLT